MTGNSPTARWFSFAVCGCLLIAAGCGRVEQPPNRPAADDSQQPDTTTEPVSVTAPSPLEGPSAERPRADRSSRFEVLLYHDWSMQETAARALGRIGPAAVTPLTTALHDPDPEVRARAATVLSRIGPEAHEAVPDLIALLEDPNENVRKAAARALGQIGPAAAPAVPALMKLLRESEAAASSTSGSSSGSGR